MAEKDLRTKLIQKLNAVPSLDWEKRPGEMGLQFPIYVYTIGAFTFVLKTNKSGRDLNIYEERNTQLVSQYRDIYPIYGDRGPGDISKIYDKIDKEIDEWESQAQSRLENFLKKS